MCFHDLQIQQDQPTGQLTANMGVANQLFDSCAKPVERLNNNNFDAATTTARELIWRRWADDPNARGATKALEVLSDEVVLQFGMIAECAEGSLQLTRFLDTESSDKAHIPASLREFGTVCDYLFTTGR